MHRDQEPHSTRSREISSAQIQVREFFERRLPKPIAKLVVDVIPNSALDQAVPFLNAHNSALLERVFRWELLTALFTRSPQAVLAVLQLLEHFQDEEKKAWFTGGDMEPELLVRYETQVLAHLLAPATWPKIKDTATLSVWLGLIDRCMSSDDSSYIHFSDLLNFLVERAHVVEPLAELVNQHSRWQHEEWSVRFQAFQQIQELLGISTLISEAELTHELLERWQPTQPHHQELKSTFSSLDQAEQKRILSGLWKGTSIEDIFQIRQELLTALSPEERQTRQETRTQRWQRIDQLESSALPSSRLRPYLGIEIETPAPRDGSGTLLKKMGVIGLHMGDGGRGAELEMSNGPFKSYQAAVECFKLWTDSGLIDLNQAFLQTLHLNVELSSQITVQHLHDFIVTLARVYHPMIHPDQPRYERLQIFEKDSSVTNTAYAETKGFVVISQEEVKTHLREYALLATAARAYEIATMFRFTNHPERDKPYTKELAEIWEELTAELKAINTNLGITDDLNQSLPQPEKIAEILKVFPVPIAHFNAEAILANSSSMVKYARDLSQRLCDRIETILDQVDTGLYS